MPDAFDSHRCASTGEAFEARVARVRQWLNQLSSMKDPTHPLGIEARRALPSSTGLSPANVNWALANALETDASDDDLRTLVGNTVEAPTAHVLLSANVFVGALRAIAIGLACSSHVYVRASRREPVMAQLLDGAMPGAFHLVKELKLRPGDHLWAYGSDTTIAQLRGELPSGSVLHAYGDGFGVVLVDASTPLSETEFDAIATDIAAFDQRGCLSPRFVQLQGDADSALEFSRGLMAALNRAVERLPFGDVDPGASAATARHREVWRCLGEVLSGPGGTVTLDTEGRPFGAPPSQRSIHVRSTLDALGELAPHAPRITAISSRAHPTLAARIKAHLPTARWSPFGAMQRPHLDGPVDRRADPRGIEIGTPPAPAPASAPASAPAPATDSDSDD